MLRTLKTLMYLLTSIALLVSFETGAFAAKKSKTLKKTQKMGFVRCGVSQGLPGFSNADASGNWTGVDVDLCRAVAAATLGDSGKVKFFPLSAKERFTALTSGEIDVLSRNTTWTLSRDADIGLTFVGVNFYDGQGFMVRKSSGITSVNQFKAGVSACTTSSAFSKAIGSYFMFLELKKSLMLSSVVVPVFVQAEIPFLKSFTELIPEFFLTMKP